MSPAAIMEFSTTTEPLEDTTCGGKFLDHEVLAEPEEIIEAANELTRDWWTGSPAAKTACRLLLAISNLQAANAITTGIPALTREQTAHLLAEEDFRADNGALGTLLQDGLVIRTRAGGLVMVRTRTGGGEEKFPGWTGEDPAAAVAGHRPKHMPVEWQAERIRDWASRLLAEGLPDGLHLDAAAYRDFIRARKRGRLCLPARAWAWCVNQDVPAARHPVSRRTVTNRLAAMDAADELVKTDQAVTRFDPSKWAFRTRAAQYAFPAPSVQRCKPRRRSIVSRLLGAGQIATAVPAALEAAETASSAPEVSRVPAALARLLSWARSTRRLQIQRWQFRDDEAWQARWNPV